MSVGSAREEREMLLAEVASVSDEVRFLIALSQKGRCSFCLGDLSVGSSLATVIKRDLGILGDKLREEVERREAAALAEGCGPDGHALDCRLQQMLAAAE